MNMKMRFAGAAGAMLVAAGCGTLDNGREREHELLVGKFALGRIAVDDPGPQVSTALLLDEPRTKRGRHVTHPRLLEIFVN